MTTAVRCNDGVCFFRPAVAALAGSNAMVLFKNGVNHRPGSLNRVLRREKCYMADHNVAQEPLIVSKGYKVVFHEENTITTPHPVEFTGGQNIGEGKS
jgi:hypothetical protein